MFWIDLSALPLINPLDIWMFFFGLSKWYLPWEGIGWPSRVLSDYSAAPIIFLALLCSRHFITLLHPWCSFSRHATFLKTWTAHTGAGEIAGCNAGRRGKLVAVIIKYRPVSKQLNFPNIFPLSFPHFFLLNLCVVCNLHLSWSQITDSHSSCVTPEGFQKWVGGMGPLDPRQGSADPAKGQMLARPKARR